MTRPINPPVPTVSSDPNPSTPPIVVRDVSGGGGGGGGEVTGGGGAELATLAEQEGQSLILSDLSTAVANIQTNAEATAGSTGETATFTSRAADAVESIDAKTPALVSGKVPVLSEGRGTAGSPVGGVVSVQGVSGGQALPVSAASLPLPTGASTAAAQTTGNASLASIDTKLPSAMTSAPTVSTSALPVRVVPLYTPGSEIHAQTSAGIANAANKLLFGFYNNTGQTIYVCRINLSNTQTVTIAGVVCQMDVRRSNQAISGGTTINAVSSPSLVISSRDPTLVVPAGITWNTNGTLGGTVEVLESVRWSTDELTANGTGLAIEIAAASSVRDIFDFGEDPIVVPNGWSLAVTADAAATNGTTLVDFNILR